MLQMEGFFAASLIFVVQWTKIEGSCPHVKYDMWTGHTACKAPSGTNMVPYEMTDAGRTEIVNRHNYLRGHVDPAPTNMMKMRWDSELEMLATKWAQACGERPARRIEHDTMRFIPGRTSVGQNLGISLNFTLEIDGWYSEKSLYQFGTAYGDQTESPGLWLHYTAMMWANSYQIGCGAATCDGFPVFVCNYAPMGNLLPFDSPYKAGTRCADCRTCSDGLCDCGADFKCAMGQPVGSDCSCACADTGGGVPAFMQQPDCSLNCTAGEVDVWFCGGAENPQPWALADSCSNNWYDCPWLCNVCPYADESYSLVPENGAALPRLATLATVTVALAMLVVGH